MKRVVITFLLITVNSISFAQDEEKEKVLSFGFNLGLNRSNLAFASSAENGEDITNGLGYRLGIISNIRMGKRFSFSPKAELSFNTSRVSQESSTFNVSPTNLEFMGHLKYKFAKNKFSPYIIAGPNLRVPIENKLVTNQIATKENLAIDFGVGLDVPLGKRIKIAPELRYTFGLMDIRENTMSISDVRYHNIALVLNISG